MSKYILQIIILLALLVPNRILAQKPKNISKWHTQPFLVEYQLPVWSDKMNYDSKSKFMYYISNDSNNLYVRVKVIDKALQMKILRSGFILWIDTLGKKKRTIAIKYPLPNPARMPQNGRRPNNWDSDLTSKRKRENSKTINVPKEMNVSGFGNYNKMLSNENCLGIVAHLDKDPIGNLYYYAIIPLKSIYKRDTLISIPNKLFSICLETGSIEQNKNPERGIPNGEGGMQGGSPHKGGMQGGPPYNHDMEGQRRANQESMAIPSELWIKKISFSKNYKI